MNDREYLQIAIDQARESVNQGGFPAGAIVVKDGKIILWKEYLDGRVKKLQASGELELEEGLEPFPWPKKINLK